MLHYVALNAPSWKTTIAKIGAQQRPNSDKVESFRKYFKKLIILMKNHKIINKNIKVVKLEILKVKTWFWNKDLSSLDSIN